MNYPTNNINNFTIHTPKDALLFLMHLSLDFGMKICPHDDIVNIPEEWDRFDATDQHYLKGLLRRCFDVCKRDGVAIFALATIASAAPSICEIKEGEDDE